MTKSGAVVSVLNYDVNKQLFGNLKWGGCHDIPVAGDFDVLCAIHPKMRLVVHVQ